MPNDPVEAHVVERDGLRLVVDPVAQAAIDLAREAGISSPASFGSLPPLDELPLRVVVIEANVAVLQAELARLRAGHG